MKGNICLDIDKYLLESKIYIYDQEMKNRFISKADLILACSNANIFMKIKNSQREQFFYKFFDFYIKTLFIACLTIM